MLGRFTFRFARVLMRGRLGQVILGLAFRWFPFALPVRWVRLNNQDFSSRGFKPLATKTADTTVLAFHHPAPSYPVHVLIVPRRRIAGLHDLCPGDREVLFEMLRAVHELKASLDLPDGQTRLVVNGGAYQDLPHLHFHLIVENEG